MGYTDIKQLLPKNVYDAAVGANAPSAANVYATMADVGGGGGSSAGTSNEFQITDNSGGFLASVVQQSGTHIIPTTTKVTDLGSATNRFNDLFIDSTIDGDAQLAITNGFTKARWRSILAGEGNGIWIGANGGNPTFANRSAFFMLENTDGGFMQPSMTIAQRTAIASPIAGLQVHTEDGTDSVPYYNHSVDGWIPTGRYAGNPNTGTGAKNGQIMASNLDGELIAVRLVGVGSTIYPANSSGNYSNNSVNLGSSGQNFLYGFFNRTYVNQVWIGGTGLGIITANSGTGAGMRFSSFSAGLTNNFMKLHGETAYKGLSVRDADIATSDRIEATAVMELQSTTRGFLPPRMTSTQMNAIATPVEGLIVHTTDADRPHYNDGTSWKGFGDLYGLFAQIAESTPIGNITTEETLIGSGVGGLSVPADAFRVGDSFHAKIGGTWEVVNNAHTITFRIKVNGTEVATTGVIANLQETDQPRAWELELDFTVISLGSGGVGSGQLCTNGNLCYIQDNLDYEGTVFQDTQDLDTTAVNTLDITAQWGQAGGAAQTISSSQFVLYRTYKGS